MRDWDDTEHFLWTEGNFSCDCNFCGFKDIPCGAERFVVPYVKILPNFMLIDLDVDIETEIIDACLKVLQ